MWAPPTPQTILDAELTRRLPQPIPNQLVIANHKDIIVDKQHL